MKTEKKKTKQRAVDRPNDVKRDMSWTRYVFINLKTKSYYPYLSSQNVEGTLKVIPGEAGFRTDFFQIWNNNLEWVLKYT